MSGEQRGWSGASDMRQEGHSPHSGREGEAPTAMLMERATQAPEIARWVKV